MKKMLSVLICFCAVLFIFGGCSRVDETEFPGNDGRLRERFLEKAEDVTVTEDGVIFTDSVGEECLIAKNPTKVVSLNASLTTLWYECGGEVSACIGSENTVELYTELIGRDITLDDGMTVASKSAAAKNWDIESIIAMQPDLILCSTVMSGYDTVKGPAEAAGIPVICADYNDFSDYLMWSKVFSEILGKSDHWEESAMRVLDEVETIAGSVPESENPDVLAIFADSGSLQANTSNTMLGEMIALLGGRNIADRAGSGAERVDISLEAVYAADPDVIFVQCHRDEESSREMVEKTYGGNPVWQSLTAVKEGRVYYLEKTLFHSKPNARFAEAYSGLFVRMYGYFAED